MLETYVQSSEDKILKAVSRKGAENQETAASFKEKRRTENTQGWKEMPLHGHFARQNEDQRNDETWTWLKEGKLKKETESLVTAAQDQAIRTSYVKATIDRSQEDAKCRMCKQNNETISRIVSGCPKLVQKEYKKRHDKNQSFYIPDVINRSVLTLGRAHCSLRRLYLFSFFGGKIEPCGWLSTEVIALKVLQSCLYKRSLMETNGKRNKAVLVATI